MLGNLGENLTNTMKKLVGMSVIDKKTIKEVVKDTDLSYILLETDAPYLSPEPYRGIRNAPSYIPVIASVVADLKDTSISEVSRVCTDNAEALFDFSSKK